MAAAVPLAIGIGSKSRACRHGHERRTHAELLPTSTARSWMACIMETRTSFKSADRVIAVPLLSLDVRPILAIVISCVKSAYRSLSAGTDRHFSHFER